MGKEYNPESWERYGCRCNLNFDSPKPYDSEEASYFSLSKIEPPTPTLHED